MSAGVSIVFVSTDEGDVLIPALESVMASKLTRDIEIVVVDNASTDGARQHIAEQFPKVNVLVRDERHGLPANLNHGIRSTSAPYVMLCNSDLVFGPNAVEELAKFLDEHPRAGIAAPKLLGPDGQTRASARRWYTPWVLILLKGPWRRWADRSTAVAHSLYEDWEYQEPKLVDWVPCPATIVRRAAFNEVGLMDERFRLYFDDVDISLRMHQGGWEVWCVPSAEIVHIEQRASIRPFSRPWRWHLESLFKFWWKHKGLKPRKVR